MYFLFNPLTCECSVNFCSYYQVVSPLASLWQLWPIFARFQALLLLCLPAYIYPIAQVRSQGSPGNYTGRFLESSWWSVVRVNGLRSPQLGGCHFYLVLHFCREPHLHGLRSPLCPFWWVCLLPELFHNRVTAIKAMLCSALDRGKALCPSRLLCKRAIRGCHSASQRVTCMPVGDLLGDRTKTCCAQGHPSDSEGFVETGWALLADSLFP